MTKQEIVTTYKKKKKAAKYTYQIQCHQLHSAYCQELQAYKAQHATKPILDPPKRSVLEEIGNAITHGVGALFAIVAYLFMLFSSDNATDVVAASVYFFGLFVMFSMSCLYHSFRHGSKVKRLFRRFDYSCIYLLIGATFAPLLLCYVGGTYGSIFLIVQWSIIATGITFIGVFGPMRMRPLHITLYLVLGWSAMLFLPQMLGKDIWFFIYILAGGIIYSLGIIPFSLNKKSAHFIWHFFVLGGAIVQWLGIYFYLYL